MKFSCSRMHCKSSTTLTHFLAKNVGLSKVFGIIFFFIFNQVCDAQIENLSQDSINVSQVKTKLGVKNNLPKKEQFKDSTVLDYLKQEKAKTDSAAKASLLKVFTPKFGSNGSVLIETYAANAQNPYQLNENKYLRADANTQVTLMGLPFNTGFYYTTENNSIYNSNKFYFSFDAYAFKTKMQNNMKEQKEAALRSHKLRAYDLKKMDNLELTLKNELEALKKDLPDTGVLRTMSNKEIEEGKIKGEAIADKQKNRLDSAKDAQTNRLEDSLTHRRNHFESKGKSYGDSLNPNIDTTKLRKYREKEAQLNELQNKRRKLEALQQNDTLKGVLDFIQDPSKKKAQMTQQAKESGAKKLAFMTDRFDVGSINPVYSEFTVQGILLRGANWQFSNGKYFGGVSGGRTTVNLPSLFTRSKPEFGRNFGIINAGLGDKTSHYIAVNLMGAKDGKKDSIEVSNPPIKNSVMSIEGKFLLKKHVEFEGEVAKSFYALNNNAPATDITYSKPPTERKAGIEQTPNMAFKGKVSYVANKNTTLSASFRRINPGFKSVGNIFLRSNIQEYEFKAKQYFYKKRISISLFYKANKDNVFNLLETTNRMKGYGGTLNVAIPKYPILTVGYMPYEQGNNHPDTLLQTNNHFSLLFANLSYAKRIGVWNVILTGSATQSQMQIRNSNIFTVSTMYQQTIMAQYKNKIQSSITYAQQKTKPSIDSLNSSSLSIKSLYSINRKMRVGLHVSGMMFKSGGFKYESGCSFEWQATKSSAFKLEGALGKIHQMWGFENQFVRSAMASWLLSF